MVDLQRSFHRHDMKENQRHVEPACRLAIVQAVMNGPLEWIAAIGTMLAASLIAFDLGRRATAWGFVLFCLVSVTWIVSGLTGGSMPIAAMNFVLLLINAWGVYQYWIHPKNTDSAKRSAD